MGTVKVTVNGTDTEVEAMSWIGFGPRRGKPPVALAIAVLPVEDETDTLVPGPAGYPGAFVSVSGSSQAVKSMANALTAAAEQGHITHEEASARWMETGLLTEEQNEKRLAPREEG